ncbi:MAG: DUF1799 domain-containing protein [Mailhella sp.]
MARRHKKPSCHGCESRQPAFLPEAVPIWNLWCRVQTQWRAGFDITGLDYTAVLAVAKIYGVEVTPEVFSAIQAMEMDVLKERADGTGKES